MALPEHVRVRDVVRYAPTAWMAMTNALETMTMPTSDPTTLKSRAQALQLHGVLSNWSTCSTQPWVATLLDWEEQERTRRSMERRLHSACIGCFKPLSDFDWNWPEQIDQEGVSELMTLQFLQTASNAILVGPSGVGKTTIAQNIAHQAVLQGHIRTLLSCLARAETFDAVVSRSSVTLHAVCNCGEFGLKSLRIFKPAEILHGGSGDHNIWPRVVEMPIRRSVGHPALEPQCHVSHRDGHQHALCWSGLRFLKQ